MENHDEEHDWVRRSRSGDSGAFEELVRRYQRMIHALTFRMTRSLADSEDLAQEVFIRAYRQLGSFRGDAKFSSWLYRIGVNTCLNWKKSAQRREKLHQDWADCDPLTSEPPVELAVRVQDALMQLPAKQRAAVVLTVYDGLNHAEAARMLGCSETTISWRVFTARRKLKQWLRVNE